MDNSNNNTTSTIMNKNIISGNNNNTTMRSMKPDSTSGSPKDAPEATGAFYRVAAQNLREFHGVKLMTAPSLEKTMTLLHLPLRRLVAQGLAPRRLLKETLISPRHDPEYRSDDDDEDERVLMSREEAHMDTTETEDMNSDEVQDEENSDHDAEVEKIQENKETEPKHPIHAALVAGGVQLRPRETKLLLRALDVSPHRFVRLGLIDRKVLRLMHGGRASHGFPQQRGLGGPYHHVPSMGKHWRGPPHLRRGHLHHGSRFGGGLGHSVPPPHARGHPGHHQHFLKSKNEGQHGTRMHGPRCSRSCSPMHRGRGRHGPPRGHDIARMQRSVPPPRARGGFCSHQHLALLSSESEGERSIPMAGFGPYDLKNRRHRDHGYGRGAHRGRVPPPHGPLGRRRPFCHHLHGEREEKRDLVIHGPPPRGFPRGLDLGHRGGMHGCTVSPHPCGRYGCPVQGKGRRGVRGRFPGLFRHGPHRGGGGHFEHRPQLEAY